MHDIHALDHEASIRLSAFLGSLKVGTRVDLTTPLVPSMYAADPDLGRAAIIDEVRKDLRLDALPMWLREKELAQLSKIGSYSYRLPWYSPTKDGPSFMERVCSFGDCKQVSLNEKFASLTDAALRVFLPKSKLRLSSFDEAAASFERTGLGWPVVSSNPKYLPQVTALSASLLSSLDLNEALGYPMIVGYRGQPVGPYQPSKTRAIFQVPRVVANLEKMIQIPLLKQLRGFPAFVAWESRTAVDREIDWIFRNIKGPYLSVDFSNFDSTIPSAVLSRVFGFIRQCFDCTHAKHLRLIEDYFAMAPFCDVDGVHSGRNGGIPSGSVLTNLVGSLANLWMVHYAAIEAGVRVVTSLVQGDDGVYAFNPWLEVPYISRVLTEVFGVAMHVEKNFVSDNEIHFLQMVHRQSYKVQGCSVGIRPVMRVLNGMLSYERFKPGWNGYMDSLRWLQQLEAASNHPCFEALCEWYLEKDRFSVLDIDTLVERAGGIEKVTGCLQQWSGSHKPTIAQLKWSSVVRVTRRLLYGV